jgi:hypothetical protein
MREEIVKRIDDGLNKRGFTTAVIANNSIKLSCIKVKAYVINCTGAAVIY